MEQIHIQLRQLPMEVQIIQDSELSCFNGDHDFKKPILFEDDVPFVEMITISSIINHNNIDVVQRRKPISIEMMEEFIKVE